MKTGSEDIMPTKYFVLPEKPTHLPSSPKKKKQKNVTRTEEDAGNPIYEWRLKMLDELQINNEMKDFLRDFANSLMKRNI